MAHRFSVEDPNRFMPDFNDNQRPIAHSWSQAKVLARQHGYGTKIELPKHSVAYLPPEFERSRLSINMTANAVYRDQRQIDSFQVREYDDKWTIELDRHNPEKGNAVAHAVFDAPVYSAIAVTAATALIGGGSG